MAELHDRLKELRKHYNMTQGELAEKLDIAPSSVGMYERGLRSPDPEGIIKFAQLFNVSTDYLLGQSENKMPFGQFAPKKDNDSYETAYKLLNLFADAGYISKEEAISGDLKEKDFNKIMDMIDNSIKIAKMYENNKKE